MVSDIGLLNCYHHLHHIFPNIFIIHIIVLSWSKDFKNKDQNAFFLFHKWASVCLVIKHSCPKILQSVLLPSPTSHSHCCGHRVEMPRCFHQGYLKGNSRATNSSAFLVGCLSLFFLRGWLEIEWVLQAIIGLYHTSVYAVISSGLASKHNSLLRAWPRACWCKWRIHTDFNDLWADA